MTEDWMGEPRFVPGAWRPNKTGYQKQIYKSLTPDQKREMDKRLVIEARVKCHDEQCSNEAVVFPALGVFGWCLSHNPLLDENS
jgi:hypothetical protein